MILRKPYAFLIKYFKVIHLILTFFSIYLVFKTSGMLSYFNDFISGNVGKLEAINYISSFYIFIIILSVIMCLVIITLMRYKKKSYLLYIILIGYYLMTLWLINYSINGLYDVYVSSIDTKDVLLHRDVLRIGVIIQYVFVGVTLVRGLGFNIKKFNFADDLVELNIDVSDDEEVELTVGNFSGFRRKLNRNIRELKYAYLENKLFFVVLLCVVIFGVVGFWFADNMIFNRVYKINDVFEFEDFKFKIVNSYITNTSYSGKSISSNSKFVVVKMEVSNSGASKEINTANLILELDGESYSNKVVTSNKFSDLGSLYKGQKVKGNKTYLFVYEVSGDVKHKDAILVYGDDKKKAKLNIINLDRVEDSVNYNIGDVIDLSKTILMKGNLKINSYEVSESFDYSYEYEMLDEVNTGNITISSVNGVIMNLKMESNYDDKFNNYSFLNKYASLKYKNDAGEHVSRMFLDKTPGSYKDGLYLVVDRDVMNANEVWFDIKVRNKSYIYKLK